MQYVHLMMLEFDRRGDIHQTADMLKTERPTTTIFMRWPSQESSCAVTHQVEAPASVASPCSGNRTSTDSLEDLRDQKTPESASPLDDSSDSDAEVIYTCPCGKKFNRSVAYKRHLDVAHSDATSYKCGVCSKTFGNERTLTMHMSVHQDSKQFTSTLERCSRKSAQKSNRSSNNGTAVNIKTGAPASRMNNDSSKTNVSIKSVNGSNTLEETPQSSQVPKEEILSSGEESGGTDKENFSPRRTSSIDSEDTDDSGSPDSKNIPPLISSYQSKPASSELDLNLPKIKTESIQNGVAIVTSSEKITKLSRQVISNEAGVIEPNKVSVITIKTDHSLLSESLLIPAKGGKFGELGFNPAGHSVIVIKRQDAKNKLSNGTFRLDPVHLAGTKLKLEPVITSCGAQIKLEPVDNKDTKPSLKRQLDDHNSVRKSQRLHGKIPGWKQMLDSNDEYVGLAESRIKRRKMSKNKSDDEMASNMVASEMENIHSYSFGKHRENIVLQSEEELMTLKRIKMECPTPSPCTGAIKTGVFKCPICERSFVSEKYLSMHMSLHKVDNSMESLMLQNNKEDESENSNNNPPMIPIPANSAFWTCKICNKVFAQNSNYKNHIRTHSDERPFVCQICSIGFKERYHLKKHMLFKHSDELKEECKYCGKKFKDSTAVRAHERIHSDVRPYSCRRCSKSFKTSECLWHHENRSKTCGQALLGVPSPGPRFKRGRQPKKEIKPLQSDAHAGIRVIPVSAHNQQILQNVQGTQFLISSFQPMTPMVSTAPSHVSASEVAAATASIQPPQSTENLVPVTTTVPHQSQLVGLQIPQQIVPTPPVATTHQIMTSFEKMISQPYPTPSPVAVLPMPGVPTSCAPVLVKLEPEAAIQDYELTAMASSEGSFEDTNQDILIDEDPEMPSVAMMESVSGIADISHETLMQVQEEIKNDPMLEDIEMSLLEKNDDLDMNDEDEDTMDEEEEDGEDYSSLLDSQDNSLKDNRFTCDKCGKQFVSAATFDKHLLTHSGLRPYVCGLCGVGFKLKVHLKKHHLYRHSDEKPCECSICGKKFKDSSAVRLHERIHSDERPFHCECGKTFKTRENLWGHRHRGPCERKVKDTVIPLSSCYMTVQSTVDPVYHHNGPIYAHASLGDTYVSAKAAVSKSQVIARAVVSNNHVTAEASIGDDGEVKATASISGPTGKAEAKIDTAINEFTARADPSIPIISSNQQPQPITAPPVPRSDAVSVVFPRQQESRVSLPVLSMTTLAGTVPTAVVAPLKRESVGLVLPRTDVVPSTSILKPIKMMTLESIPNQEQNYPPSYPEEMSPAKAEPSLPPFETFSPTLRGKGPGPTVVDKCPTIHKYLQMPRQPVKLPGIQQLFQSHSLVAAMQATGDPNVGPNFLALRRPDPSAPLGPHPSQTNAQSPARDSQSPRMPQTPHSPHPAMSQPMSPHQGLASQMLSCSLPPGVSLLASSPVRATHPSFNLASQNLKSSVATSLLRATSPYPGNPGLPLLFPSDPSLASAFSIEGMTTQSPAEPVTSAPTISWEDEPEKKGLTSTMWQAEQEQLFQDLTQTTAFGQL